MSHKLMVDGTVYHTQSGRVLTGGTAYSIQSGLVMTEGTVYRIPFGTAVLTFGQDNTCGAEITLQDVGQMQMIISSVPQGETATAWLEVTKNGSPLRLQKGDEVTVSCRVSRLGTDSGTCGMTFYTDPTNWEHSAVLTYDRLNNGMLSTTFTLTEACYARLWVRLTGTGTLFESVKASLTGFTLNGETVTVQV